MTEREARRQDSRAERNVEPVDRAEIPADAEGRAGDLATGEEDRAGVPPGPEADVGSGPAGAALVEQPAEAVRRLEQELDGLKDRYLRLAAEFENYKKRMARERAETWARAQAEVVSDLLDALDDLGRVTAMEPGATSAKDLLEGVVMVERKLLRALEGAGLERVGSEGEDFDPTQHEAVGTVAARASEDDGTIADVLQPGYRFGKLLLRPARVRVAMAQDEGTGGGVSAGGGDDA